MDEKTQKIESGSISITAQNMFPIIKKWLYSEKDIFIRELTSNCADAISKLERLVAISEAPDPGDPWRITVRADSDAGTLSFEDNGIGMTADEVRRYINQVAFSGAKEFFEKYKNAGQDQIIGHFGLGFYSAFMASKRVTIETLSYQPEAKAVKWESEGGTEYTLSDCDRQSRGTKVTLELDDESREYANKWTLREVLLKYFRFLPVPVYIESAGEDKPDEQPINPEAPLWEKPAAECTDEEYKAFYHKVFSDAADPLFWVHLNIDYPFRLKGILYFPKLKTEFEGIEGQVKLYCSRVFVADNIKEVIPEYLLLLKGCIDCPDLPLNVSRSFLQNDGTVSRLSAHITRKVADRLLQLFNKEREKYNNYWDDINPFIKYGCLRDDKFYERVKPALIFKLLDGTYKTVDEYLDAIKPVTAAEDAESGGQSDENGENKEQKSETEQKTEQKVVYYATDPDVQAQYIAMFRKNGIEAVILNQVLDGHFITLIENKNPGVRFKRIDSDLSVLSGDNDEGVNAAAVEELFKPIVGDTKIKTASLASGGAPAVMTLTEESRRMREMAHLFGGIENAEKMFPQEYTLILNSSHPLYKKLEALVPSDEETAKLYAAQIYDLARIAQRPLSADDMTAFLDRSAKILEK